MHGRSARPHLIRPYFLTIDPAGPSVKPPPTSAYRASGWRYREAPIKQAVKPPEDRWYGVWIERFIEVANGRKLAAPRAEEVEAQLRDLGAFGDVLSRQFRQAVGAIQILIFRALDVPGAGPWTGASGRVV